MSQAPLPAETRYWHCAGERPAVVNALFDQSAPHYDRACAIMSLGLGQRYRRDALARAGVRANARVLDVGVGTGLLAREIARLIGPSGRLIGLDPSWNMIARGRDRFDARFVLGIGDRLPFAEKRFDFVTMGYALRHVEDLDAAFAEYRRVLARDGRLLLLEISRPESALGLALARFYFGTIVPLVTRLTTGSGSAAELMRLYWDTIARCVPPATILASLRRSGFPSAERKVVHGIFSEYVAVRG